MKLRKPRKLPKAERVKQAIHQRLQHDRSQVRAAAREARLRELMGLPVKQQGRAK